MSQFWTKFTQNIKKSKKAAFYFSLRCISPKRKNTILIYFMRWKLDPLTYINTYVYTYIHTYMHIKKC